MSFSLVAAVQYQQEIKKSRFEAYAWPIQHENDIAMYLQQCFDASANHQCWAWKMGQRYRFNDAGEPTGTAGKPILAAIEGQDLSHVLVVVNRWFGGIKLGTGGLVRAYGSSAGQCLVLAEKVAIVAKTAVKFQCLFAESAILQYYLQQQCIAFDAQYTAIGLSFLAQLTTAQQVALAHHLQELTRGREQLHLVEEEHAAE